MTPFRVTVQMTNDLAYGTSPEDSSCIDPPDPKSSTVYEDITGIDNHPQKLEEDYNVLQHPQVGERKHRVQYEQPDYSNAFPSELYQTIECGQQDTLATDSHRPSSLPTTN